MMRSEIGGLRFQQSLLYEEDDMEMAVRRTECLVYIYIWGLRGLRYDLLLVLPMVLGDVAIRACSYLFLEFILVCIFEMFLGWSFMAFQLPFWSFNSLSPSSLPSQPLPPHTIPSTPHHHHPPVLLTHTYSHLFNSINSLMDLYHDSEQKLFSLF